LSKNSFTIGLYFVVCDFVGNNLLFHTRYNHVLRLQLFARTVFFPHNVSYWPLARDQFFIRLAQTFLLLGQSNQSHVLLTFPRLEAPRFLREVKKLGKARKSVRTDGAEPVLQYNRCI